MVFGNLMSYNPIIGHGLTCWWGENKLTNWNFNPYSIALIMAGFLSLGLSIRLILRWTDRKGLYLGLALAMVAEWSFFVGFESAVIDTNLKIIFAKLSYFGVYTCVPFFFIFVIHYFGLGSRLTRWNFVSLWIIPFIIIILAATNELHYLIWAGVTTPPDSPFNTLVYSRGPMFWVGIGFNYLIIFIMTGLLFSKFRKSRFSIYRNQSLIVFLSILPPWLANFLYLLRIPAVKYLDFTPFGFFLTGFFIFVGLNRFRLLEIAPIARDLLFDRISDGIIVMDLNNLLVDINTNGMKYLKLPHEEWMGLSLSKSIIEIPNLMESIKKGRDFEIESIINSSSVVEIEGRQVINKNEDPAGWLITIRDISARKQIQKSELERRQFAEALRDVSMALNSTLNLDEVLERILVNIFKFLPCKMANIAFIENGIARVVHYHGYVDQEQIEWVQAVAFVVKDIFNLQQMVDTGEPVLIPDTRKVDYWLSPYVLSYIGAPISIKEDVIGFINLDSDQPNAFNSYEECERLKAFADLAAVAIDNARMYAKMKESAIIDALTQVNNRRNLLTLADNEFQRAVRYDKPVSIIMLDVDNFKRINDEYGHLTGDFVLVDVGKALNSFIRKVDIAGRYGGDEFCVILPETSLEEAIVTANRLLDEFNKIETPEIDGRSTLQASMGVACNDKNIHSLEALLARSDEALYLAKKRGRNQVASL
jgi:diguanylate cyclase (GGDEF)-like protein